MWFASGAVMIYVPFPDLPAEQRLAGMVPVEAQKVLVPPAAAVAQADDAERLRLVQGLERPVYLLTRSRHSILAVGADNGEPVGDLSAEQASRIGALFAGTAAAGVAGPFDYDQWVVHQRFDPYRPLFRVDLADDAGTELYVSSRSGEVVQRTDRRSRGWNYVGAVAHWIYPTVLRKSQANWDVTVWWLSLVGIVVAVAGAVLGIVRTATSLRRRRNPVVSAFAGWMKWHHLTGLAGGVLLITWIFSGWLSMDHSRLFSTGAPDRKAVVLYRGLSTEAATAAVGLGQIAALGPFKELEIAAVDGQAWLVMRGPNHVVPAATSGAALPRLPDDVLIAAVHHAWPDAPVRAEAIPADDFYGRSVTETFPETMRRFVVESVPPLWIHVDAASGDIVTVMDRSRRVYRWLFNGLHNFDLPGLTANRTLRIAVMLPLLALGFALSLTGVVIGVRRLRAG
jgi:hypothetical protein